MKQAIAMGLVGALLAGCTGVEEDDPTESTDTSELGTSATVLAIQASAATWWALTIQEDKVNTGNPNQVTLAITFVLGGKTPGPPQVNLKFRVNAFDEDTASAGGILIGLALTAGMPLQQAIDQLAGQANIVLTVDHLVGAIPPGPPNISMGKLAHVGDLAIHADRPGGGCIIFDAGLVALGLPDGCTEDSIPPLQTNVAGAYFSLASMGPQRTLAITETMLAPAADGSPRFQAKYAVGVREAAIAPQTVTVIGSAPDELRASMGTLAAGAGLLAQEAPFFITQELFAAGIPLKIEKITWTDPGGTAIPPEDIANLVDATLASVGPGGGCIWFGSAAGGLGFQLGCATGEH